MQSPGFKYHMYPDDTSVFSTIELSSETQTHLSKDIQQLCRYIYELVT